MPTETLARPLPPAHDVARDILSDVTGFSEETGTHLRRVCSMSVRFGRELRLGREELEDLKYGALLHDIGKKLIDPNILHKPGRLDPAELHLIRTHAALGADLAARHGFGDGVVSIVRYHHERFDGDGYPEGLAGGDIPHGARVLAVVDTVDTIMHERAYDPARSYSEAVRELTEHAGRQFDPALVEKFLVFLAGLAAARGWNKQVA